MSLHPAVCPADVLLSPSKWHQMHWSGDKATLTLNHLNKEDEGLYTLRVTTKSGYETYSAYVFVRGEQCEAANPKYVNVPSCVKTVSGSGCFSMCPICSRNSPM